MSRTVSFNGGIRSFEEARLPIMDRGFLFSDGVYEVSAVLDGKLVDNDAHLIRLDRSLSEIQIQSPYSSAEWTTYENDLIRRNGLTEGVVYIQVTRGVAERGFTFSRELTPTVVMFTQVMRFVGAPLRKKAPPSSRFRISAGSDATSNPWDCWRKCSPSSRPPTRAPPRSS